ncbi:MAG: hypothetical protein WCD18_03510 [Thermosynechococcaceae cyanobacterium]
MTVISLPLAVGILAVLSSGQSAYSQDVKSKYSRQAPQDLLAPDAPDSDLQASAKPGKTPSQFGIVRSVSGGTLVVRTLEGTTKQLTVPESLAASVSGLQRGSLVGFETDAAGSLTQLQPPETDRTFEGTISTIQGTQVTLTSATGESLTTPIAPATISRMGLAVGKPLKVTQYKGNIWASKLCVPETAAPVVPVTVEPAPTPVIPSGGGFTPPPVRPVPALW